MILLVCLVSCTTSQDIQKKMATGNEVNTTYDYDWEKVYEAIRYVLQNSDVYPIAIFANRIQSNGGNGYIKYTYKEKAILIMCFSKVSPPNIEIAIYFEPGSKSTTKVKFVKGYTAMTRYQDDAIEYIIYESRFFLKNDGQGYNKYTKQNSNKWYNEHNVTKPF